MHSGSFGWATLGRHDSLQVIGLAVTLPLIARLLLLWFPPLQK